MRKKERLREKEEKIEKQKVKGREKEATRGGLKQDREAKCATYKIVNRVKFKSIQIRLTFKVLSSVSEALLHHSLSFTQTSN